MARRPGPVDEDEDVELNMTPMLDVVFILLIFFIVTAVFVKEPGPDVERPIVDAQEDLKPVILIAITAEDEIWVDKKRIDRDDLKTVVEGMRVENPKGEAIVQGDAGARFEIVFEVMQALQDAGIPRQHVSTDDTAGG